MASRSGRLVCPRCGTNNFDTVSVCWKCAAPLGAAALPAAGIPQAAPFPQNVPSAYGNREYAPPPAALPMAAAYPMAPTGSRSVAVRAALALAITIPWIGLPVGWAFMMVEDRQRQSIGRLCATVSLISLFVHLFLMAVTIRPLMTQSLSLLVRMMQGGAGGGMNGGTPSFDMDAPDAGSAGGSPSFPRR